MGAWESQLFKEADKTPLVYFRYVDDIWGVWTFGEQDLHQFHEKANAIHPRIQVDLRFSTEEIEFLDMVTFISGAELKTRKYSKLTARHLYLHHKSDHPVTVKNAIPYGLAVTSKRICSEAE